MTTIAQLLSASPLPRLETRLLLEHTTGLTRVQLMAYPETELAADPLARYRALEARRVAGEPIAYLLGEREFFGRCFQVTPAVLIPRPETEHLVEAALAELRCHRHPRVLDLGTGSGAIAITLALEYPAAEVIAVDQSTAALAVARANAEALGARLQFLTSDWYQAVSAAAPFEVIVSNPPYIERHDPHLAQGDVRFEPRSALTDEADGLDCLRQIFAEAPRYLAPHGWIGCEHGYDQGPACRELATRAGLIEVSTLPDLAGHDRITVGRRPA